MQSADGKRQLMIHYWCDYGSQTIDFTLAQASLYATFSNSPLIFSALLMEFYNQREQAILLKQFKDSFPKDVIHICHLATRPSEPPRYMVVKYNESYFLGPATDFMQLAFESDDLEYFIIPNDGTNKWNTLKDIYIPAAKKIADNINSPLSELFKPKQLLKKPMWIQPTVKANIILLICMYIDLHWNCYFNISKTAFEKYRQNRKVRTRTQMANIMGIMNDYNDMPEGRPLALFGHGDMFQLAQNSGNLSKNFGIYQDHAIIVEFYEDDHTQMGGNAIPT